LSSKRIQSVQNDRKPHVHTPIAEIPPFGNVEMRFWTLKSGTQVNTYTDFILVDLQIRFFYKEVGALLVAHHVVGQCGVFGIKYASYTAACWGFI